MNSVSLEPTQASGSEEIDDESSLVDLGNLAVVDSNPLDTSQLGSRDSRSKYLLSRSERCMQMLAERLWKAPIEQTAETVLAELPKPSIAVPREKPVPKPAPPTKWEQYAKLKGIQKKKRSRMVFDETSKDWKPRWGAQRAGSGDWLTELSDDEEPTKKKQKSLKALSTQHKSVLDQTKASTASAGKFFDPAESTKAKAHKKSKSKKRAESVSAKSIKKGKVKGKGKGKGKGRGQAKKKGRK